MKKSERVPFRIAAADLERWQATAATLGLTLSEWIRRVCNAAETAREKARPR